MFGSAKLTTTLVLVLILSACNLTRNVPEGKYLLAKNKIVLDNDAIDLDNVTAIVRQQPNQKTAGMRIKLRIYNMVDTNYINKSKAKSFAKFNKRLIKKRARALKVNQRRIERAQKKGKGFYTEKIVKDTTYSKVLFSERIKYKFGQKPIVFDSILFNKSVQQLGFFLKKSGYYYGSVTGKVEYNEKKRLAIPTYTLKTGPVYMIDTVRVIGQKLIREIYNDYVRKHKTQFGEHPLSGKPFDVYYLDEFRENVAKYMRDENIYKFYSSTISYVADTFKSAMKVNITLRFEDRFIPSPNNPDSLIKVPFQPYYINDVYFHLADTLISNSKDRKKFDAKDPNSIQFMSTFDTIRYAELPYNPDKRKELKVGKNVPDPFRMTILTYNGKLVERKGKKQAIPWLNPGILELQNYLEHTNKYKEYYFDRSYRSLNQLGVFATIKPILVEIPGTNKVDVHYFLEPTKKQSFAVEPKFTTSFGLLGVNASLNYTNKNLFRGAQKLTLAFGGGFESQPQVFEDNTTKRTFNTFEIGPSLKYDTPGLFPIPVTLMGKRQKPRTVMTLAYNFENRDIFNRRVFQFNYMWKFFVGKTQIFQMGLPTTSVIKFVNITKSQSFIDQLYQINDPFLNNTYSNQFIWQDFKFSWEFNNKDKDFRNGDKRFLNASIYYIASLDAAGNTLSLFKSRQDTLDGQALFNGLAYAQFVRLDNQYIISRKFKNKTSLHLRLNGGGGIPYGNSRRLMPYDYSFFGGGSNDNRGWRARALGPGAYQYHLDTNRLATQIADIRLGGSLEYRFSLGSSLKGAVFTDFGNIWTYREDQSRLGSQFKLNSFYKEFAVAAGVGLRMDLDFFVVRLDFGFPIYNPALGKDAHWVFQDLFTKTNFRQSYYQEGMDYWGKTLEEVKAIMPKPFRPTINFGIGYPF